MKKIIISVLAVIILTSCWTPKIENPNDALKQNQDAIVKNLDKLIGILPNEGNSKWSIDLKIDSKEVKVIADLEYNFNYIQDKKELDWNIKLDFDINVKNTNISPIEKVEANIDLDLIKLKNKIIYKLNELNITNIEEAPQLAIILWLVAPFQKKWYFKDLPKDEEIGEKFLYKNKRDIINAFKKYTIFEFIKENENKDFYDYDVKLNSKNIVSIYKEVNQLIDKEYTINEEEIKNIEKQIRDNNSETQYNIKINKTDLELFTLVINNKDLNIKIENNKKEFNFIFNNNKTKLNITFEWKKSSGKLEWKIIIKKEKEEIFNWNIKIETDSKNTEIKIDWIAKKDEQELKIYFSINDESIKRNVTIEEPKEAKDLQKVINWIIWSMMWGTNIQIDSNIKPDSIIEK